MTISGGAGVVLSDNIEKQENLIMATYTEMTKRKIAKRFPKWMKTGQGNPVDVWPAIEINGGVVVLDILNALNRDDGVDIIVLTMVSVRHREWDILSNQMFLDIIKSYKKPIFLWIFGDYTQFEVIKKAFRKLGIPVFTNISSLTKCISKIVDYVKARKNDLKALSKGK
jgi:acyl-CoA synthetase (NDP forming)